MNKIIWLLGAFISSAMFLFSCSSPCNCSNSEPSSSSSSSIKTSSSSSSVIVLEDQDLVKKNIRLSSDDGYADIDGKPAAYTEEVAATKLDKIDLIVYCSANMGCKNNSIYSPWEIKLFETSRYDYPVFLFEIPDDQAEVFKTATRLYEILPTYNNLIKTFSGTGVYEIPIQEGRAFFVSTSEDKYGVVIIKEKGDQSVDLEIVEIPIPGH